ncbi:MAG: hypothetical protein IIA50_00205 [Bacteroidetes bacterium]|nr:hypothetical protein [Bacteroidota bacterium]
MQFQSDKFDSRRLRKAIRISTFLVGLWIVVESASAQAIRTRTISDDGLRAVLEFQVDWSNSLKTSVDSSGIAVWDGAMLARFTAGFEQISLPIRLGSLSYPRISVTERDFDEVCLTTPYNFQIRPSSP